MCSAISIASCFTFFPGNEFGFLHDAFVTFVVEDWKDFAGTPCASRPPSFRKNSFTPLEISAAPQRSSKNRLSPSGTPWIMFFQNVDAIVGPDEPIVYPEHLTKELDYALEFAVVLKKFVQLRQKDRIVVFLYEGKTFRIVGV
jgi:hypothetical protein